MHSFLGDEFAARLDTFPLAFRRCIGPAPARSRPPTLPLPLRAQRPALGPRWSSVGRSIIAHCAAFHRSPNAQAAKAPPRAIGCGETLGGQRTPREPRWQARQSAGKGRPNLRRGRRPIGRLSREAFSSIIHAVYHSRLPNSGAGPRSGSAPSFERCSVAWTLSCRHARWRRLPAGCARSPVRASS